MAKGRMSFSSARTGQRKRGGGGDFLQPLKWDIGDRLRLVFPVTEDGLVIFAKPYHRVLNKSVVLLKADNSGTYPTGTIRCMHPFSQVSPEETRASAESGEICLFCDIAKYEQRRKWEEIREEFGEDGFAELSKKEMKEYFQNAQLEDTVEASYYTETDDEGNKINLTHYDMYILALQLSVKNGKVEMDADGVAKYTPIIMPVSKARLNKFKDSVDDAVLGGAISEDLLYPYVENEGTDDEEEIRIGFVDFMVNFPKAKEKMESGRNMSATPVSESLSAITDELIEDFQSKEEDLVKKAGAMVNSIYKNLRPHTREEALDMLDVEEGYFEELEEQYRENEERESRDGESTIPSDDDSDSAIIAKALEDTKYLVENDEDDEDSDDEEEEEKPKKKTGTKKRKKATDDGEKKKRKKRNKVAEEEDFEDEDSDEEETDKEEKPKTKRRKRPARSKSEKTGTKKRKKEKPVEEEELDEDDFEDSAFDV